MKLSCVFARILSLTVAAASTAAPVLAQDYPTKEIRVVVGYAPGGGADIMTRYFSNKLRDKAGASVIVVNKPGASGNLAAEEVSRAKPDGYTLLFSSGALTGANRYLFKSLPYDPDAITKIAPVLLSTRVLAVSPSAPVHTTTELIAYVKKRDRSFFGSTSPSVLAISEAFKAQTGIPSTRVEYKTTEQALIDLKGGFLDFVFFDATIGIALAKSGQIRLLGISSGKRASWAPELPTVSEAGLANFDYTGWMGMYGPPQMPKPVVDKLNGWLSEIVMAGDTQKFLFGLGSDPYAADPAALARFDAEDATKWISALRAANVEPQ